MNELPPLSRREREIMELLYRDDGLTAAAVRDGMHAPPGYSAIRALLRILEQKGHVRHERRGPRYVYWPVVPKEAASKSAPTTLIDTFFSGVRGDAAAALIRGGSLSRAELDHLAALIETARDDGR